jgi:hypothetical protein
LNPERKFKKRDRAVGTGGIGRTSNWRIWFNGIASLNYRDINGKKQQKKEDD